jgi:hypothetical protein
MVKSVISAGSSLVAEQVEEGLRFLSALRLRLIRSWDEQFLPARLALAFRRRAGAGSERRLRPLQPHEPCRTDPEGRPITPLRGSKLHAETHPMTVCDAGDGAAC